MEHGVKFRTCNFKSLCRSGPLKRVGRKLTYYKLDFYTSSASLTFSDIDACNFMAVCSFCHSSTPSHSPKIVTCILWQTFRLVHGIVKKRLLAPSCLSIHVKQLDSHWTDFIRLIFENCSKICWENSNLITIQQEYRILYVKTYAHSWQHFTEFFLQW